MDSAGLRLLAPAGGGGDGEPVNPCTADPFGNWGTGGNTSFVNVACSWGGTPGNIIHSGTLQHIWMSFNSYASLAIADLNATGVRVYVAGGSDWIDLLDSGPGWQGQGPGTIDNPAAGRLRLHVAFNSSDKVFDHFEPRMHFTWQGPGGNVATVIDVDPLPAVGFPNFPCEFFTGGTRGGPL